MGNQTITGIGCFAGPEKLSRIFLRMVQSYALGGLEDCRWIDGRNFSGKETAKLIKALVHGYSARQDLQMPEAACRNDHITITGFFMFQKDRRLELSIFARKRNSRQKIHSAVLTEITRIRQKRLN